MSVLLGKTIGFLGCGNMSIAIIKALIDSQTVRPEEVWASNRSSRKLDNAVEQFGIQRADSNDELLEKSDIVVISVKPQDLYEALEPICSQFEPDHIVISVAAGVQLAALQKILYKTSNLIRIMPNTPVRIQQGVIGVCTGPKADYLGPLVENIFKELGAVIRVEEGDGFEAITVGAGSGIGFVFELMLYWQEWLEEHGITGEVAKEMTVQTFLGAAHLASESKTITLEELQRKVVSKKGVTAAGLQSMRELEIERLLRYSFEKAVLRDRALGQG